MIKFGRIMNDSLYSNSFNDNSYHLALQRNLLWRTLAYCLNYNNSSVVIRVTAIGFYCDVQKKAPLGGASKSNLN